MTPTRLLATSVIALLAGSLLVAGASAHSTLSDITQDGEGKVTLPVVPESKLIIHATRGIDKSTGEDTVQSLPLAVFLTLMTPDDVVDWYREQLPDYTVLRSDSGEHAQVLEKASDDTRIDGPDTYRIPNIRIQPTDARTATHMKGARTMLQVYYQPAPESESEEATDGEP
ncbi:hypothetical protein [Marinobacter zhanjiangensis]|uniref:Uncharacterized protein n=1 Tax=Marinobacter zhanjiangensis TaxID=578215 RepID=A0ABQ3ANM7_9GAMM|nr:hypothetical protein [Marinobacter zhanjiangensis]GGY58818.1 hypothetical protein GCM10007071_01200 [Marinobacter zhanjiangensis]